MHVILSHTGNAAKSFGCDIEVAFQAGAGRLESMENSP